MEVVFSIAPVGVFGLATVNVILPCLVWLSRVPVLLEQNTFEEGDVLLSSVKGTNRSLVVLRASVDEKEEAEENEELHPCPAVRKVIRRRAGWSFIPNPACRHQTVPTVTRNQARKLTRNVWGYLVTPVTRRDQVHFYL